MQKCSLSDHLNLRNISNGDLYNHLERVSCGMNLLLDTEQKIEDFIVAAT